MKLDVINNKIKGKINKKLCVISDIHYYYDYKNQLLNVIENNIRSNKPDYICIPGDLVDRPEVVSSPLINNFYKFIEQLGKICTVIISVGNHDINQRKVYDSNKKFWDKLSKINNVYVLNNSSMIIGDIRFIGYTQNYCTMYEELGHETLIAKEVSDVLSNIDNKKYNILLAHDPLYIGRIYDRIKNYNLVNLMLSGHTHGGMVPSGFKGNWALVSPCKRLFVKNSRGYFKNGNTDVIVSGGVIKLSHEAGLFHLFNFVYPSSIDYIDIEK